MNDAEGSNTSTGRTIKAKFVKSVNYARPGLFSNTKFFYPQDHFKAHENGNGIYCSDSRTTIELGECVACESTFNGYDSAVKTFGQLQKTKMLGGLAFWASFETRQYIEVANRRGRTTAMEEHLHLILEADFEGQKCDGKPFNNEQLQIFRNARRKLIKGAKFDRMHSDTWTKKLVYANIERAINTFRVISQNRIKRKGDIYYISGVKVPAEAIDRVAEAYKLSGLIFERESIEGTCGSHDFRAARNRQELPRERIVFTLVPDIQ